MRMLEASVRSAIPKHRPPKEGHRHQPPHPGGQLLRRDRLGSSTKTSRAPSLAHHALDATQEALIAKLESSREPWQTIGRYEPERALEHPASRRANGAQIRASVPHEAHAEWTPPKRRPNPVDIVVAGNAGRQEHLVPLRIGRMAASPFAFLRGGAAVMAWDLSHTPVTGIQVIIDGDAHINNFGLYGTPQRDVVVDLNDSTKQSSARGNGISSVWSPA